MLPPKPNIKIARRIEARTRNIVKFLKITTEGTLAEKMAFLRKEGYKDAEIILAMGRVKSFS
jgi:hypothetical protein